MTRTYANRFYWFITSPYVSVFSNNVLADEADLGSSKPAKMAVGVYT